jgi:hypothetical protein
VKARLREREKGDNAGASQACLSTRQRPFIVFSVSTVSRARCVALETTIIPPATLPEEPEYSNPLQTLRSLRADPSDSSTFPFPSLPLLHALCFHPLFLYSLEVAVYTVSTYQKYYKTLWAASLKHRHTDSLPPFHLHVYSVSLPTHSHPLWDCGPILKSLPSSLTFCILDSLEQSAPHICLTLLTMCTTTADTADSQSDPCGGHGV